jgi:hypothetical protein
MMMSKTTAFNKKKKNLSSPRSPRSSSSSSLSLSLSLIIFLKIGGLIICTLSLMNISYQYGITVGGDEKSNNNNGEHEFAPPPPPPAVVYQQKEKESKSKSKQKESKKVIPKYEVPFIYKKEQNRIDYNITDEYRCKQFGVKTLKDVEGSEGYYKYAKKRKIFLGSMLADENKELLLIHATEVYNKYDNIAFVESNTTHFNTIRNLNYDIDSDNALLITKGELFGVTNKTNVNIEYYNSESTKMSIKNHPHLNSMNREVEQRNLILGIWIKQGMEKWDIGIMSDIDEIVSRDFLNALRICDFPILRYNPDIENNIQRSSCQKPKMVLSTIQYEASPKCIKKNDWFHPDIILGNCLLGIGDNSGRITPKRNYLNEYGQRTSEYGKNNYNEYPNDIIINNRYPLWDGRDIRTVSGNSDGTTSYTKEYINSQGYIHGITATYGTAYHLHNWFNDLNILRHK